LPPAAKAGMEPTMTSATTSTPMERPREDRRMFVRFVLISIFYFTQLDGATGNSARASP
jgi:hypothetical protein